MQWTSRSIHFLFCCATLYACVHWLRLILIVAHRHLPSLSHTIFSSLPSRLRLKWRIRTQQQQQQNHPNHISVFDFSLIAVVVVFFFFLLFLWLFVLVIEWEAERLNVHCSHDKTLAIHTQNQKPYNHIAYTKNETIYIYIAYIESWGRRERTQSRRHDAFYVLCARIHTHPNDNSLSIESARHTQTYTPNANNERNESPVGFMYTVRNVYMCFSARKTEILMFYF